MKKLFLALALMLYAFPVYAADAIIQDIDDINLGTWLGGC